MSFRHQRLVTAALLLLCTAFSHAKTQTKPLALMPLARPVLLVEKTLLEIRGGALGKKKAPAVVKKPAAAKATKATKSPAISNPNGASIPSEVFNLVKAIVGVGVLSLPAGVAAFADAPSAVVPALALIGIMGVLSGFGFAIIGKVCAYTGATSYREAWKESMGESTSWIPAWSATLKTSMACLAISMVLGDTFAALFRTPRTPTLVGMTLVLLLPLCLMKNLKSLAPFSLLGVIGMVYTAVAMSVRWLDGSYSMTTKTIEGVVKTVPTGRLVRDVAAHLRPSFGTKGGIQSVLNPSSLILLCMLSTAYMVRMGKKRNCIYYI